MKTKKNKRPVGAAGEPLHLLLLPNFAEIWGAGRGLNITPPPFLISENGGGWVRAFFD
jgi:hypothetical protein